MPKGMKRFIDGLEADRIELAKVRKELAEARRQLADDAEKLIYWELVFMGKELEVLGLKEKLSALQLRWQTGKPPRDGWYWLKTVAGEVMITKLGPTLSGEYWSGPIDPPTSDEGKEKV